MKKLTCLLYIIYNMVSPAFAQPVLKKYVIADSRVDIMVPVNYMPLTDEKNRIKAFQPDARKNSSAILSFWLADGNISDNDIPAFTDDQLKLAKQDDESFKYLDDGIYLQDGKNIGYIKFSTSESGKKFFNYIFFISDGEKPLVFSFTCRFAERKKWETEIDNIANSIRIVERS